MNYNGITKWNNIGGNNLIGRILGLNSKMFANKEIDVYLNGKSHGIPYYFISPVMSTNNTKYNKII